MLMLMGIKRISSIFVIARVSILLQALSVKVTGLNRASYSQVIYPAETLWKLN